MPFHGDARVNVQSVDLEPERSYYRDKNGSGLFINMVKLHAADNLSLRNHLRHCQEIARLGSRNYICFLSSQFISNTLSAIRRFLVQKIVTDIKNNGGEFGLLSDATQDISVKSQNSLVVRYVDGTNAVVEHTIAFFEAAQTTGSALFELYRTTLNNIGLSILNTVGCSFDGAANLRSENVGVVAHIKAVNPDCIFTWCLSHRFNLCVRSASKLERF